MEGCKFIPCSLPGLFTIESLIHSDTRGSLSEVFNDQMVFETLAFRSKLELEVVSSIGVLRGLHYQLEPAAQAKIVRVVSGQILDVVVDIRKSSKTFGKYFSTILDDENKKQLYIPRGFAHGYYTLAENTIILYKLDGLYVKERSRGIMYNDDTLGVDWNLTAAPILSKQDSSLPRFINAELFY